MAETPSKRRRKGREAFEPGVDPMDVQPYKEGSWGYFHYLDDWLEGWREAEAEHHEQAYNQAKGEDEFEIYWSDLNEETQKNLKEEGFWHENIDLSPIAILCRPEED
jgi:hypothetical protein